MGANNPTKREVVTVTVTAVTCAAVSMRGRHRHYTQHSTLAHVTRSGGP